MIDWRKGLLRLYFLGWGMWTLLLGMRTVSRFNAGFVDFPWGVFVVGGLVLPGVLFLAYRWTLDGFFGHQTSG